jgi:hypothetical protein
MAVLMCAGCGIFASLPDPDPVWKAAVQVVRVGTLTVCLGRNDQRPECLTAPERVENYLGQFLPLSSDALYKTLPGLKFHCTVGHTVESGLPVAECSYVKSYVPRPCVVAVRASILVDFPDQRPVLEKHDLKVHVFVAPDPDYEDDRGCFPM